MAKINHYKNDILENKDNPKKLWKTLKQLGAGKANSNKPRVIGLNINGELNFDKKKKKRSQTTLTVILRP